MNPTQQELMEAREQEDIRASYQAAVQMAVYEGQKRWTATTIFLQVSITLVAISLVPAYIPGLSVKDSSVVGIVFSILGFIATLLWLSLSLRYGRITYYWILSVRELEQKMSLEVQPFNRGRKFAKKESVLVDDERIGYGKFEYIPEYLGIPIVYIVFLLIFLSLIVLNLCRL